MLLYIKIHKTLSLFLIKSIRLALLEPTLMTWEVSCVRSASCLSSISWSEISSRENASACSSCCLIVPRTRSLLRSLSSLASARPSAFLHKYILLYEIIVREDSGYCLVFSLTCSFKRRPVILILIKHKTVAHPHICKVYKELYKFSWNQNCGFLAWDKLWITKELKEFTLCSSKNNTFRWSWGDSVVKLESIA